jgi:hypothetical protein
VVALTDGILVALCLLYFTLFERYEIRFLSVDRGYLSVYTFQIFLCSSVVIVDLLADGVYGVDFGGDLVLDKFNLGLQVIYKF